MSTNVPHVEKELDLSNAGRGVWLVKVPKYIANKWEKAPGNIEVGKLKITKYVFTVVLSWYQKFTFTLKLNFIYYY